MNKSYNREINYELIDQILTKPLKQALTYKTRLDLVKEGVMP